MINNYLKEIIRERSEVLFRSQFLRFILVGGLNTLLAYTVYALALSIGFFYPAANFIALVAGIVIGFTTQGKFVFYRSDYSRFWRFLLCWSLIYCVNVVIIGKLISFEINPYWAGAMALPVVIMLSFIFQKYFVFVEMRNVVCSNSSDKNDNSGELSKGD